MSPYRVPAPPPVEEVPQKLWPAAPAMLLVGSLLSAGVVGIAWRWIEMREALARLEAQEEDLRRRLGSLPDCCACRGDPIDAEERARLEEQLEEAKKKQWDLRGGVDLAKPRGRWSSGTRILPTCRCATGDPLCAEIPGQTCTP